MKSNNLIIAIFAIVLKKLEVGIRVMRGCNIATTIALYCSYILVGETVLQLVNIGLILIKTLLKSQY